MWYNKHSKIPIPAVTVGIKVAPMHSAVTSDYYSATSRSKNTTLLLPCQCTVTALGN